jgi:alginate O-acetyltransferase complex protein AlgI
VVFNSDIFLFAFLPTVFVAFWLARGRSLKYLILTVASYVFYGYWNWRFCLLLLFSTLFSFLVGIRIDSERREKVKTAWMVASIVVDLAVLGVFKYYDFAIDSLHAVGLFGALPVLQLILPIGISFYTFHTISYIVDVRVGRIRATRNLYEYFSYVGLFFQLVAGPIVRFSQIREDLDNVDRPLPPDYLARGIGFFAVGMIKKVVIADSLARYVDDLLAGYAGLSTGGAWLAAVGYSLQLYFDFSGYSDMAVGLGCMFGLRIPQNFDAPYRAVGVRDFWQRWHISLSSWLRDYLYIPLGGNRRGPLRTYANLMLTMLLGGLWHGASWTFVAWGGYHGALLVVERLLARFVERVPAELYRWITFGLVVVGWVLFRSTDFTMARVWLGKMAGIGSGSVAAPPSLLLWVVLALGLIVLVPEPWRWRFTERPRWAAAYALGLFVAYLFMNGRERVFLYYQF